MGAGAGDATWLPELGDEVTALLPWGEPMEFVWIPPGSFVMGSTHGEAYERRALGLWENSFGNEQPALEQTIGEGFYLGKYEITQRQCTAAMGTRPGGGYVSGHHNAAAVCLSWDAVQAFVAQLNAALGDSVYRLPTEAEWEYAARAGSVAPWFLGSDFAMLGDYAWAKGARSPLPVGLKRPNPWGLYDIDGNAWEWVQEELWPYGMEGFIGQVRPLGGDVRVMRGGVSTAVGIFAPQCAAPACRACVIYNIFTGARLVRVSQPAE